MSDWTYWSVHDQRAAAAVGHAVASLYEESAGWTLEADARARFLGAGAPPEAVMAWRRQLRVAAAQRVISLDGSPGNDDAELLAKQPGGTATQRREADAAPAVPAWPEARPSCLLVDPPYPRLLCEPALKPLPRPPI
jgi:hypothetical protein